MIVLTATKAKHRIKARRNPDYEGYEAYKKTLWNVPLLPEEYEAKIKAAVRRYGV